eukprot:jgi/Chlat1/2551/Chrsp175S02436
MAGGVLALGVIVLALLCVVAAEVHHDDAEAAVVVQLTADNWDSSMKQGDWLVEVYAPWCGACQQLAPTWHALPRHLQGHNILVGKVDGTEEKSLAGRLHIKAYPTILLFKNGKAYEYTGSRSMQDLVHFADTGFKSVAPKPFWADPNSLVGRALFLLLRLPDMTRAAYKGLLASGFSHGAIVGLIILVPAACGLLFIVFIDVVWGRRRDDKWE